MFTWILLPYLQFFYLCQSVSPSDSSDVQTFLCLCVGESFHWSTFSSPCFVSLFVCFDRFLKFFLFVHFPVVLSLYCIALCIDFTPSFRYLFLFFLYLNACFSFVHLCYFLSCIHEISFCAGFVHCISAHCLSCFSLYSSRSSQSCCLYLYRLSTIYFSIFHFSFSFTFSDVG